MSLPITARNSRIVSVTSPAPPDTRRAKAGAETIVYGVRIRGEPSTIKNLSGISFSSGKVLQGELMFGHSDSGKPMFWLQGRDKNYLLHDGHGMPVTNAVDAEARAIKLIQGGGATQLRQTGEAPGSNVRTREQTQFDAPNRNGKLRINLEDPDINHKGSTGATWGGFLGLNPGRPGSKLTSDQAVAVLKSEGVAVKVFKSNPAGSAENAQLGAIAELSNDAQGGAQYARATAIPWGYQPDAVRYSLPKGASAEFKRGYEDEKARIGLSQVGQSAEALGEGFITAKSTGAQQPSFNAPPINTEQVSQLRPKREAPGAVTTAARAQRSQTSEPTHTHTHTHTPAPASPKNADRLTELLSDDAKMAEHFHARAFGERPGSSPTSYLFGGHAVTGPFAGLKGGNALELEKNANARVKEMLNTGTLKELGGGAFNDTYIYKPTGQVVRIGSTNSEEMSATASYSNFRGRGKGAQLDLDQSLFVPKSKGFNANHSYGFGVLVMERVPGASLASSSLAKVKGELSPSEQARLMLVPGKVADAVVDMHMHRRAHGDLHRGNVMFDKATGEARVIDFGSSRRTTDRGRREQDVYGLGHLIDEFGHKTNEPRMTQAKAMYLQALDRYAGPDKNAPVYKNHPELYEPHLQRFNERKAALRSEMAE